MRRLVVALVLLATASGARALEIRSCHVRLDVAEGGSARGTVSLHLAAVEPGRIAIPLGFADVQGLRLASAMPAGTTLTSVSGNGQTIVLVDLPQGVAPETTLSLAFEVRQAFVVTKLAAGEKSTLPEGSRLLRHALVNSQPATIGSYRAEVLFPDGMRAHAIREALPKLGKKESEPRVRLTAIEGRNGARLQVARLLQGDSASMQLELVPRKRSPGWLIAGLILSVLYLVHFRDLIAKKG